MTRVGLSLALEPLGTGLGVQYDAIGILVDLPWQGGSHSQLRVAQSYAQHTMFLTMFDH
jgi:hypothetical protein